MKQETYLTQSGEFPGHQLHGKQRYANLYHYTTFEAFVKIWLSKTLKFSPVKNVNDVYEAIRRAQVSVAAGPVLAAYADIRSQYKQISLNMDYNSFIKGCMSPAMWGYYGDRNKGVCIELDYAHLKFPKTALKGMVSYRRQLKECVSIPSEVSTQKDIEAFIRKNNREEFFVKHWAWKGENEYRVVSKDDDVLSIEGAITAIYLTSYKSNECICVEKLVGNQVPVKFLDYDSVDGWIIPKMSATREMRERMESASKNPKNIINTIQKQAMLFYEQTRDKKDLSLKKATYIL